MFFSVRRYCPAHFHVWSNILLWRFRTYSSEGISAGLVRSSMAQALACRLFSRSHSLSSSFVAKLGMRSASSSGESGVLPSLPVPSVVISFGLSSGCVRFLPRSCPRFHRQPDLLTPCCAQRRGRFPLLSFSRLLPLGRECFRSLAQERRQPGIRGRRRHREGSPRRSDIPLRTSRGCRPVWASFSVVLAFHVT